MKNKIRALSVAIGEIGGAKRTAIRDVAYPFISNNVSVLASASVSRSEIAPDLSVTWQEVLMAGWVGSDLRARQLSEGNFFGY